MYKRQDIRRASCAKHGHPRFYHKRVLGGTCGPSPVSYVSKGIGVYEDERQGAGRRL